MADEVGWKPTKSGAFTGYEPEIRLIGTNGYAI